MKNNFWITKNRYSVVNFLENQTDFLALKLDLNLKIS